MSISPDAGSAARNQYGTFQVHVASDAQQAYVRNLIAGRIVPTPAPEAYADLLVAVADNRLNKKAASRLIDWLLTLPHARRSDGTPRVTAPSGFNAAWRLSPKQFDLIRKVAGEKPHWPTHVADGEFQAAADSIAMVTDPAAAAETAEVTKREASAAIDFLFAVPRAVKTRVSSDATEPEVGMYRDGDTIYRVYLGQQSGRNLVKRVVRGEFRADVEDPNPADPSHYDYEYEYVGAASRVLPETATRLSLEEAKAWGRMTSSCCVCAARLDNPESVEAGIGPVCGGRI